MREECFPLKIQTSATDGWRETAKKFINWPFYTTTTRISKKKKRIRFRVNYCNSQAFVILRISIDFRIKTFAREFH